MSLPLELGTTLPVLSKRQTPRSDQSRAGECCPWARVCSGREFLMACGAVEHEGANLRSMTTGRGRLDQGLLPDCSWSKSRSTRRDLAALPKGSSHPAPFECGLLASGTCPQIRCRWPVEGCQRYVIVKLLVHMHSSSLHGWPRGCKSLHQRASS